MKRFVYALDLIDDRDVIERHKAHHRSVPDEVAENLPDTGIRSMEIFVVGNRLINIVEAEDDYDPTSLKVLMENIYSR